MMTIPAFSPAPSSPPPARAQGARLRWRTRCASLFVPGVAGRALPGAFAVVAAAVLPIPLGACGAEPPPPPRVAGTAPVPPDAPLEAKEVARAELTSRATPRDTQAPPRESDPANSVRVLALGGGRIRVSISPAPSEGTRSELLAWVARCARAVIGYYGAFPVAELELRIRSAPGTGIHGGQTLPTSPPRIEIVVGEGSTPRDYQNNWSLTHEMVHLAFPNVPSAHHWLEEGLATYVEPIARARSGWISEESVWREWIENMPRGLPAANDGGLDGTDSWGRTYWGGALFCLLADVEIQKRSAGRYGLVDGLRAIVAAGGNVSRGWPLERALRTADTATGTTALIDTYNAMKVQPLRPDLARLWQQLGVRLDAGGVRYDDRAPLAALRQRIVAARSR
jgi:hypothetical protein